MALIVEDGTGKSTADAYVSTANAATYHTDRNNAAWSSLSTAAKEAAIRYATAALDGMYAWTGTVISSTQALGWPRSGADDDEGRTIDSDVVPTRVVAATCELALLHATAALNSSYERGGAVRREKIGPLEFEYEPGAGAETDLPILSRIIGGLGARRSWLAREVVRG